MATSLSMGILVFVLALRPVDLIVWINLFALAGQEIIFLCPLVLGLYWKGANKLGAICSIVAGATCYLYLEILKMKIYSMHNIVPALVVSLVVFVIASKFGERTDDETLKLFFDDEN